VSQLWGLNNSCITTTVYKIATTLLYTTEYIVKRLFHKIFTRSGPAVGLNNSSITTTIYKSATTLPQNRVFNKETIARDFHYERARCWPQQQLYHNNSIQIRQQHCHKTEYLIKRQLHEIFTMSEPAVGLNNSCITTTVYQSATTLPQNRVFNKETIARDVHYQ
jgi:hypothetical protein